MPDPAPRHDLRRQSGLGIAGFVLGLIGFITGWIPLAGFLGTIGAILAFLSFGQKDRRRGLAVAGLVLGLLATCAAAIWTAVLASGPRISCPHVYAWDGSRFVLDADPLSGSIFRAGESEDQDRLEHLSAVAGRYRLRVVNELEEVDHLDAVSLLVVDHRADSTVLPSSAGGLLEIRDAAPPLRAADGRGRDLASILAAADDRATAGELADHAANDANPRRTIVLDFPRPAGEHAALVLRAHNTRFAAEAFVRYLGEMGSGLGALLHLAEGSSSYPYRRRLEDEMRRLGLTLRISRWDGARWTSPVEVRPIGPAVQRSFAVPLVLPRDAATVHLRVEHAPLLWELDQAQLGQARAVAAPVLLRPTRARLADGRPALEPLLAADGGRLSLRPGEHVELELAAPPPPPAGQARSVVLAIRGYYEFEVAGRGWLDPIAIWRHRTARDSLPRFALRLARAGAR
jgi:hypothetical protein